MWIKCYDTSYNIIYLNTDSVSYIQYSEFHSENIVVRYSGYTSKFNPDSGYNKKLLDWVNQIKKEAAVLNEMRT